MPAEDQNGKTLETFRQNTYDSLIEKGIQPPQPTSKEEKDLYEQWLRGRIILEKNEH